MGSDPVKWIDRLVYINATSSFSPTQKSLINDVLTALRGELNKQETKAP
jgi:hypothetical protein